MTKAELREKVKRQASEIKRLSYQDDIHYAYRSLLEGLLSSGNTPMVVHALVKDRMRFIERMRKEEKYYRKRSEMLGETMRQNARRIKELEAQSTHSTNEADSS